MERKKRITGIDSIKGLAILAIVFYHLLPAQLPGGFLGVNVFLFLSGYFAMSHLYKHEQGIKAGLEFLIKQLKKLYPPLFLVCLCVVSYVTLVVPHLLGVVKQTFFSALLFVSNWGQILTGASYFDRITNQSSLTHLWYLALNVQFYLVLIILFALLKRQSLQKVCLGIVGLSAATMFLLYLITGDINRIYYGTDTRAMTFFLGSAVATVYPKTALLKPVAKKMLGKITAINAVILVVLVSFLFMVSESSAFLYVGGFLLFDILLTVFFITGIHPNVPIYKALCFKPLVALGKRSYIVYLWYFPILQFYALFVGNSNDLLWGHIIIQWCMLLLVTELTYQLFDAKTHVLKNLLQNARSKSEKAWLSWLAIGVSVFLILVTCAGLFILTPNQETAEARLQEQLQANQANLQNRQNQAAQQKTPQNAKEDALQEESSQSETKESYSQQLEVTFIGDSVMVGIADKLLEVYPKAVIDGALSRQFYQGVTIVESLKKDNRLAPVVVIELGTNGAIREKHFEELMNSLEGKKVFFVTNYMPNTWQNENNQLIREKVKQYDNAVLVDWHALAQGNSDWFYKDLIHVNPTGRDQLIQLIQDTLYQYK